jgi:hypothetical protein
MRSSPGKLGGLFLWKFLETAVLTKTGSRSLKIEKPQEKKLDCSIIVEQLLIKSRRYDGYFNIAQ